MKTFRKIIIPTLLTVLTAVQFLCLIKGVVVINWFGVCGYLNAIIGFGVITAFSWWVCIGLIKMDRENLQPTKETMKYRRRKNGKED
jgi:hypothetical protein